MRNNSILKNYQKVLGWVIIYQIVYPMSQAGITMYFYNNSGTAKQVWFNFKFLRDRKG